MPILTALKQTLNARVMMGGFCTKTVHAGPIPIFHAHVSTRAASRPLPLKAKSTACTTGSYMYTNVCIKKLWPRLSWCMPLYSSTSPSCADRRTSQHSFFSIATTTNVSSASTSAHHSTSSTLMTCHARLSRESSRIPDQRRSY